MATYDPRQTFKAQQEAYGRASGVTSSKSAVSGGRGSIVEKPGERAAALKKEKDKLVKSQFDQFKRRERNLGLGSMSIPSTPSKPEEKTFDQKIYEYFVNAGATFDEPEQDVYALPVYESPMFRIPTMPEVTVQGIKDSFDQFNVNPFKFGGYDDTRDEAPQATQMQDPDMKDPRRGLMSSPTMDQPDAPEALTGIPRGLALGNATPTKSYIIKDGDTLSEIARDNNTTVKAIMDLNTEIEEADVIDAGATIQLPLSDTQAALRRGFNRDKEGEGVEVAGAYSLANALLPKTPTTPDIEGYTDDDLGIPTGPVPEYMFMTPGSKFTNALKAREADNYDTLFGNAELFDTPFKDLKVSEMTVDEVLELTKLNGPFHKFNKKKGHNTTAVGKYQIVGSTLRDLNSKDRQVLKKLGITGDTKFDQKTQDDIAAYLAVHRIKDRATKGDGNIATRGQARKEMRNEWEGFKKLSDEELDDIIDEVAREVGVTIVETKPSNSVRPPIRPLGRS